MRRADGWSGTSDSLSLPAAADLFRDRGAMLREERMEHLMQILPEDRLLVIGTKILFEDHLITIFFFLFSFRLIFPVFISWAHTHIDTNTCCFKIDTITGNSIVMIDGLRSVFLQRERVSRDNIPLIITEERRLISEETIFFLFLSTSSHKICFLLQIVWSVSHAEPFRLPLFPPTTKILTSLKHVYLETDDGYQLAQDKQLQQQHHTEELKRNEEKQNSSSFLLLLPLTCLPPDGMWPVVRIRRPLSTFMSIVCSLNSRCKKKREKKRTKRHEITTGWWQQHVRFVDRVSGGLGWDFLFFSLSR